MDPVRIGCLGAARITKNALVKPATTTPGAVVTGIAARDAARATAYASKHNIANAYASYAELLAAPSVDAVYNPLPNGLHGVWTVRALEAGKHVLCEKPLSRQVAEVERAFATAERERRLLMEAFMYRHNPQTKRVKELVDDGAIGRLRMVRASFSFVASDPANVRLASELDGGALMDVGCYCVSGTRLLAGEPVRVSAEQSLGGDGVDIAFAGVMRFDDDVVAHFDAGLALHDRDELEVVGDGGALFLDDPWHCRKPVIELRRDSGTERIELQPVDSYGLEAENLSAAIRGQASPLLGREDALGQARAIEALYESADGGHTVTLA